MIVHVRGSDPMTLAPQLRDLATAVGPALRLVDVQRVTEANNDILWMIAGRDLRLLSFTVARRTREIGVCVALGASRPRIAVATFRRPLLQVALGIVVGTAIIVTVATMIKYTELPGSESDLTLRAMAKIIGYGIVMLGVCMLGCVEPTRRALSIEPTIALRTE
jgi:putative ABC transport system permease protein